jgi:ATP-binding cassette subfamily F protein 3
MANDLIDAHSDKSSMRDKRKLRKANAAAERKALSSKNDTNIDENVGGNGLVSMNVRSLQQQQRDGSGTADKTRDILVRNVTVSLNNGTTLLESGELKFSYQRRYGLIGENGVGKSTLLKAIADGKSIEQFPTHLRILHVRQEVPTHFTNQMNVLQAVLQSDIERNMLLEREKELQKKLEQHHGVIQQNNGNMTNDAPGAATSETSNKENTNDGEGMKSLEKDLKELESIYARLQVMSADSAEARAAMILSGLQFTVPMQQGSISDLSGGWRMRVALAAALFIEPDLLMLVCT